MFRVLRHRNFAILWVGQVVSGAGDWLRNMAMLFWVFAVTGGEKPLATAATWPPWSAPAGSWVGQG